MSRVGAPRGQESHVVRRVDSGASGRNSLAQANGLGNASQPNRRPNGQRGRELIGGCHRLDRGLTGRRPLRHSHPGLCPLAWEAPAGCGAPRGEALGESPLLNIWA